MEDEPNLGHPSNSRYVVGPPARQKSRSEKVAESEFGQWRTPPAYTAAATYRDSREGLFACVWSPR